MNMRRLCHARAPLAAQAAAASSGDKPRASPGGDRAASPSGAAAASRAAGAGSSSPDLPAQARLFLALWPAPGETAELVRHLAQWRWPAGASLVRHECLHLTLHFIGALERRRLAEVSAGLRVPSEDFALPLSLATIWPRGIAVLQTTSLPEPLVRLHGRLAEALRVLGLPVEARDFRPHVTLARRASGAVAPVAAPPLYWQVGGYVLVESLRGAGAGYVIRERYG